MPETTQFSSTDEDNQFEGALKPNTILLARYKILGVLGGGGQGAVYQARDLNFPEARRLVAIKEMLVPTSDPTMRASAMKTFQREANILATLSHPAIPRIYDFFDQNDRAYLVQEFINGSDMEALLTKTKSLPMDKILEWAVDLCDVLQYLHSHEPEPIIFRDMKPANVMIDSLGKVRLIDFGIAKIFVRGVKQTMIGTEGYSAPEQYKGDANPLSDIYSLGATLHHVITRKDPRLEPPFSFADRPIMDYNSEATEELSAVLNKALEFEPSNRFQSCAEMKNVLQTVQHRPFRKTRQIAGATSFFDSEDLHVGVEPRWTFKTEDEIRSSPVSFRGMVFVGSYDTNIWALNLENGEFQWKRPTEGGITSSPIIEPNQKLVLFGSEDFTFNAVDYRSGHLSWTYTTHGKIRSTGRIAHGHVFFGSDDGKVYALVAGNGRWLWEYDAGSPVRTCPFVTNDRIIVGTEGGEVIGLELSGSRKWAFRTRHAVLSSPFVDDEGACYVGAFDGYLYALDASSGFSLWKFRTFGPIVASPVAEDDVVYFGSTDGNFYAVNTQTGKEVWKAKIGEPMISSPVLHNGAIYFGCTDGSLYCLNQTSGQKIWQFETADAITGTPHIADDIILVGSMDKALYALPLVSP